MTRQFVTSPLAICTAFAFGAALPAAAQEKILTLANDTSIDANWEMSSEDSFLARRAGCYEGLTTVDTDLVVQPSLATAWEQIDDLTWEFTLREGVKFQDGTDMDAEAVAGSLNYLLALPVQSRSFSNSFVESVTATDPMTVTITLKNREVTLPGRMAAPHASILSPAAYSEAGVDPVNHCTGAFAITEWSATQGISLTRFDDYWGGPAKLDGGEIRFIPDANIRSTMVRTGEAQIARFIPAAAAISLESESGIDIIEVPTPRISEVILQTGREPFDNIAVRQAMRLLIDAATISATVYEGKSPPAGSMFRSEDPWAPANAPVVTANVEQAMALFAEAGVDPATLEVDMLAYTLKTELRDIAQIVQAMLGQAGITVNIRIAEYSAIEGDLIAGNFDLALMSRGYLADAPEPIGFLAADYTCEGGFNLSQFCDPMIDEMVETAAATVDYDERMQLYGDIAQYVYDEAVMVYLVNETIFDGVSESVVDYVPHPMNYDLFVNTLDLQ